MFSPAAGLCSVLKTVSGVYCLLLLSTYISVIINQQTHSHLKTPEREVENLLCYLYIVSCLFLLYMILYLARLPTTHDNVKSHGTGFLRQGAVVFGLGSMMYHLLEFVEYFILRLDPHCYAAVQSTLISGLAVVFAGLQTWVVVMLPRLNINQATGLPHLGMMHLVATNLVIWLRALVKESLHEKEALYLNTSGGTDHHYDHSQPRLEMAECREKYHADDYVTNVLNASSPFLYAFIIEFSLVGGTFFYNTWNSIHTKEDVLPDHTRKKKKTNLCATIAKTNWDQSSAGTLAGVFVLLLTLVDLVIFFTNIRTDEGNILEYLGKIFTTSINFLGLIAAVTAFFKLQRLGERKHKEDNTVDLFLLNFGMFFVFVYSCFTITVGVFDTKHSIPGSVLVINGVIEIIAVTAQIILIHQLLLKTIDREDSYLYGRNLVVFLSFVNFSIWLFNTFELQKSKASLIEADYFGHETWIWLQRITLPVCVFFRFVLFSIYLINYLFSTE